MEQVRVEEYANDFEIQVPVNDDGLTLEKSQKEGEPERRCVKGFGSTEDEDQQGETILQKGLDLSYLQKSGFINYDHQKKRIDGAVVPIIIGVPTLVEFRKSKDGKDGLWVEGELINGPPEASEQNRLANEMWHLGLGLQKAGGFRKLSYSIEGKVTERRGGKIVKAEAHHVALTHKPVNAACTVEMFAKSFCCGRCNPSHPQYDPFHGCANKGANPAVFAAALEKALETTVGANQSTLNPPLMGSGTTDAGCQHYKNGKFEGSLKEHMTKCLGKSPEFADKFIQAVKNGKGRHDWAGKLAQKFGIN